MHVDIGPVFVTAISLLRVCGDLPVHDNIPGGADQLAGNGAGGQFGVGKINPRYHLTLCDHDRVAGLKTGLVVVPFGLVGRIIGPRLHVIGAGGYIQRIQTARLVKAHPAIHPQVKPHLKLVEHLIHGPDRVAVRVQ